MGWENHYVYVVIPPILKKNDSERRLIFVESCQWRSHFNLRKYMLKSCFQLIYNK